MQGALAAFVRRHPENSIDTPYASTRCCLRCVERCSVDGTESGRRGEGGGSNSFGALQEQKYVHVACCCSRRMQYTPFDPSLVSRAGHISKRAADCMY